MVESLQSQAYLTLELCCQQQQPIWIFGTSKDISTKYHNLMNLNRQEKTKHSKFQNCKNTNNVPISFKIGSLMLRLLRIVDASMTYIPQLIDNHFCIDSLINSTFLGHF